ncbi:MAG: sulfatase-like hydrolase/transferase [Verrucomicrobia bacterium]|nr:sulfatase-like hydrolase/transferase [Verrucomicrobiota bacterium]
MRAFRSRHSVLLRLALCPALAPFATAAAAPRPPNLILIVSDDQGFDLACYGSKQFVTPHLDRMAAEGVRATSFYVTASVCTPSRSGLITGRYPQRNGTYEMIRNDMVNYGHRYTKAEYAISPEMTLGLDPRELTFGDVLHTSGYRNACFGKWDMGQARRFLPLQRGFDVFVGHGNNGIDYYTHERYGAPSLFRGNQLSVADKGTYATELFRREAVSFVRAHRDRPFFLYLPFNAPHAASNLEKDSNQVPAHYLKKYYPDRDPALPATKYAGMVTAMDEAIGELFAALRELGLDRDTFVLFMADNGRNGARIDEVRLRGGKSSGFEGGLRVPLLAWWPGVLPAGRTTHEFLTALEILPTLTAAGGARLPTGVKFDGFDMLPVLQGKTPSPRQEMFWDWPDGYQAARVGNWKWISHSPRSRRGEVPETEELFDLAADPGEKNNLIKAHPERLAAVKARFAAWQAEMEAAEPRGPFRNH